MERLYARMRIIGLFAVWAISACAVSPQRAEIEPAGRESSDSAAPRAVWNGAHGIVHLLRYAEHIRALPLATLQHEYTEAEQQFASAPTPDNRLRLAMLLSLPSAPFRNDARARQLLTPAVQSAAGYAEFTHWLLVTIDERRALEEVVEEERRRRQALRAKLDQLKAIEEDMDRRMQPPVINPR